MAQNISIIHISNIHRITEDNVDCLEHRLGEGLL